MGDNMDYETRTEKKVIARVAKVLSDSKVIITKGSNDGLTKGQRLCVYSKGEEVVDPETGESLGHIEVIKGNGYIVQIQERISILEAKIDPINLFMKRATKEVLEQKPVFNDVREGDFAKTC